MSDVSALAHAVQAAPSISICANEHLTYRDLNPVLWGMEEEGVPAVIEFLADLNPLTLAHRAAQSSRLGVGVGLSLGYIVVTTDKLPIERPYLATENPTLDEARQMGANAARLVRRVPLKG